MNLRIKLEWHFGCIQKVLSPGNPGILRPCFIHSTWRRWKPKKQWPKKITAPLVIKVGMDPKTKWWRLGNWIRDPRIEPLLFNWQSPLLSDGWKESESEKVLVTQSCPTLFDPMDYSLPGSSVHEILQARILEWIAISFSRRASQPREWTQVSHIAGRFFIVWATREALSDGWSHPNWPKKKEFNGL